MPWPVVPTHHSAYFAQNTHQTVMELTVNGVLYLHHECLFQMSYDVCGYYKLKGQQVGATSWKQR